MFENDLVLSTRFAYDKPLVGALEAIRASGFRSIELVIPWKHLDWKNAEGVAELTAAIARLELSIHSLDGGFGGDFDFLEQEPPERVRALSRCRRAADVLQTLGGKSLLLRLSTPVPEGWQEGRRLQQILRGIRRILELCEERGLTLVIETSPRVPHDRGSEHLDLLLDRLPPEVALSLDVSEETAFGVLLESVAHYAPRIAQLRVGLPDAPSEAPESAHRKLLQDFLLSLRPRTVVVDLPKSWELPSASSRVAPLSSVLLSRQRMRRATNSTLGPVVHGAKP